MTTKGLAVDDEESFGKLVRRHLERRGVAASAVGDGKEALAPAGQVQPNTGVLDVTLPGFNEVEVWHRLRQFFDATEGGTS